MEELELTEGGGVPWVPIIIVGVIAFGVGAYNGVLGSLLLSGVCSRRNCREFI